MKALAQAYGRNSAKSTVTVCSHRGTLRVMAELRRWNEATPARTLPEEPAGTPPDGGPLLAPADRPDPPDRPAGPVRDRGGLAEAYRDDPDDIFGDEYRGNGDSATDDADDAGGEGHEAGEPVEDARPEVRVDRPELPPDRGVHYGTDRTLRDGVPVRPEVFDGPPTREQAVQGVLGDCGVIAALGAVAGHRPDAITDLIEPRADGSHLVRLHEVRPAGPGSWQPTGQRIELLVEPDRPVLDVEPDRAAFANTRETGVGWAATLEKALAGADSAWPPERSDVIDHRGYDRLDQGTYPTDQAELLAQLTGRPAAAHLIDTSPGNEPAVEHWLRDRMDAGSPILVGTRAGDEESELPSGLAPSHAYEVVSALDGRIVLRNPWGRDHPGPLSVRDFLDSIVPLIPALRDEEEPG